MTILILVISLVQLLLSIAIIFDIEIVKKEERTVKNHVLFSGIDVMPQSKFLPKNVPQSSMAQIIKRTPKDVFENGK